MHGGAHPPSQVKSGSEPLTHAPADQGILAVEGSMDRMEALLKDRQPIDVILLFAAEENDSSKIGESFNLGG